MNPQPPPRARPGDLTLSWRLMLGLIWVGAFLAYAAVYQASVQVGIGAWWIGPRAQPTPSIVRVLPFFLSLAMVLCLIYNVRHMVFVSMLGAVVAAAIAVPDLSRTLGLGVVELIIAALALIASLAAVSGRYQLRPTASPAPPDSNENVDVVATHNGLAAPGATEWAPPQVGARHDVADAPQP